MGKDEDDTIYESLTDEFHEKAKIDHQGNKEDQHLWLSMLTEEVGELAEAVNKFDGNEADERIGEELADVLVVSFGFARVMDIDLRNE
ncbi:MAG: MazG nucleotide pyrophosphohydrolase domain-containing protein, partial [Halobacteria archaeon]|nr:MazG nucleotide pyrophosphohydrolase domain-containing protein [Halobacteria archaeon]